MGCRAWGTLNFGSPVIATLEQLDWDWGPHSCTFPDCGLVCAAILRKARGAESHWDMRVEQRARHWKAPVLGESLAETSIIEHMCGSLRAFFLDLSKTAFVRAGPF
ncbi:hypothetical protein CRG98_035085 [Punica granatum]|uniref:Uncharacterized protein n=1 Tax=Punica granatum TaxID=22663 RepID=A0A2I0IKM4_PUNGR|nr:hypothetical protein CRG98_035085 [Punica granatum]